MRAYHRHPLAHRSAADMVECDDVYMFRHRTHTGSEIGVSAKTVFFVTRACSAIFL